MCKQRKQINNLNLPNTKYKNQQSNFKFANHTIDQFNSSQKRIKNPNQFKIVHLNIRSLNAHINELKTFLGQLQIEFDFICLTIIASWISAFGLATNNSVIVVASMVRKSSYVQSFCVNLSLISLISLYLSELNNLLMFA